MDANDLAALRALLTHGALSDLEAWAREPLTSERMAALAKAAKGSKKRDVARVRILLASGDSHPGLLACTAVRAVLAATRHPARDALLQFMPWHPSRIRFAPELREIATRRDDPGWPWAVSALGALHDEDALPTLLAQTQGVETPFCLLQTLVELRAPEARPVFEANLAHDEGRTRTFALWGLAALGDASAFHALVALLDDPDVETSTHSAAGESWRAAKALSELRGWPFDWRSATAVADVRARCAELLSQNSSARQPAT